MAKLGTRTLSWVLALALLVSTLVPFVGLRPRAAEAAATTLVVTPTSLVLGANSGYAVTFTDSLALPAGSTITLTFANISLAGRGDVTAPTAASALAALTMGTAGTAATATTALAAAVAGTSVAVTSTTLVITIGTSGFAPTAGAFTAITFSTAAGIINPLVDGAADTVSVQTSPSTAAGAAAVVSTDIVFTGVTFTPTPLNVSSPAQYVVAFTVSAATTAGVDTVAIIPPTGTTLPTSISKSLITVGWTGQAAVPLNSDPVVASSITLGGTPTTRTITLQIPGFTPANVAVTPIAAAAAAGTANIVTITISQLAGLVNTQTGGPTGSAGSSSGSAGSVVVSSAIAQQNNSARVNYLRTLTHSPTSGVRGTAVTSTASGLVSGSTATVFNDNGAGGGTASDNVRNGGEVEFASQAVGTDGKATLTWTASVPALSAGSNASIKVRDNSGLVGINTPAATFTVSARITPSQTAGAVGTAITITGEDFTAAAVIDGADVDVLANEGITIAGTACGPATAIAVSATGTLPTTAVCTIPVAPAGSSTIRVFVGGSVTATASTTFTIQGSPIAVSPTSGVPGTPVTVTSSNLTAYSDTNSSGTCNTGDAGFIAAGGITIGGNAWSTSAICTDSAGSLPAQIFNVPANQAPGTYQVTVTDAAGLTGSTNLIVPERVITVSSASGRRDSIVTVSGTGYARTGGAGGTGSVTVNYVTGTSLPGPVASGATIGTATAQVNASGAFTTNLTVPTNAAINSINTITAVDNTSTASPAPTNSNAVTHTLPSASITVSPTTVAIGSNITIVGIGFQAFTPVTVLSVGGLGVLPASALNTGADGGFTTIVLVPAQNTGTAGVSATVGPAITGVSASQNITLSAAVVNVATQLAALTTLQRAWAYDNVTQKWKLYQPSAPASVSDLTVLAAGDAVVIVVTSASALTTSTFTQNLVAGTNIFGWR